MSVPAWSEYAVSPLWGVGSALIMSISSGADWSVPFYAFQVDGATPLDLQNPVIEMRRDKSTGAQLMAHLDTSAGITEVGVGSFVLAMDAEQTAAMPSGRGFWDCFGQVNGQTVAVASGVVVVSPRVTASPVPFTPPEPPPPPITVDTTPQVIDLAFPAGDDFHLALGLIDTDDGQAADLSQATVDAAVTTSTGTVLAPFVSSINGDMLNLTLPAAATLGCRPAPAGTPR